MLTPCQHDGRSVVKRRPVCCYLTDGNNREHPKTSRTKTYTTDGPSLVSGQSAVYSDRHKVRTKIRQGTVHLLHDGRSVG